MKKLLTTIALITAITLTGQTRLTINQDAKLAFYGDDKGNNAFTSNLTFRVSQFIVKGEYFNPILIAEYELADLKGGYYERYGFGIGLNILVNKYIELQGHFSAGFINRYDENYTNPELVGNIAFKMTKNVSLILEGQRSVRNDLKGQPIIYSGKIGFRINIFNKPVFKK